MTIATHHPTPQTQTLRGFRLSRRLRHHIYIPLGGGRDTKLILKLNTFDSSLFHFFIFQLYSYNTINDNNFQIITALSNSYWFLVSPSTCLCLTVLHYPKIRIGEISGMWIIFTYSYLPFLLLFLFLSSLRKVCECYADSVMIREVWTVSVYFWIYFSTWIKYVGMINVSTFCVCAFMHQLDESQAKESLN